MGTANDAGHATCPHGFRVVGGPSADRRWTNWRAAFAAHVECDPKAESHRESFLSMFTFDDGLLNRLNPDRVFLNVKGFDGPCYADWLWIDLDSTGGDLDAVATDARRLVGCILQRFPELDDDDVLAFFSGAKGFHVGIPAAIVRPEPSVTFNRVARLFCERLATDAGVKIDTSVYDTVRLFRSPNSRHPKTGLHKRRLTHDELMRLSADRIRQLAVEPQPFDVPTVTVTSEAAADLWTECEAAVRTRQPEGNKFRPASGKGAGPLLTRSTLDLIHCTDLPEPGQRERTVFRAVANLTEAGAPPELVSALLDRPGRESGLSPNELAHAVRSGIEHANSQRKRKGA